jgi:translation elongation factor EF-Tu-like GTPase
MNNAAEAEFEIRDVFKISGRGVVLGGQVLSGIIRKGMRVRLALNGVTAIEATVTAVEIIDRVDRTADIGLVIDVQDPDGVSLWKQLCEPGRVVPVYDLAG